MRFCTIRGYFFRDEVEMVLQELTVSSRGVVKVNRPVEIWGNDAIQAEHQASPELVRELVRDLSTCPGVVVVDGTRVLEYPVDSGRFYLHLPPSVKRLLRCIDEAFGAGGG